MGKARSDMGDLLSISISYNASRHLVVPVRAARFKTEDMLRELEEYPQGTVQLICSHGNISLTSDHLLVL